jgi:hypothetical protein
MITNVLELQEVIRTEVVMEKVGTAGAEFLAATLFAIYVVIQ